MPRAWLAATVAAALLLAPARPAAPPARLVRVTRDGSFKQNLQFAPDGQRLLMTRIHAGKMGLWTVRLDGSEMRPLLDPDPRTPHFDGHFSSDGKRVVFVLDVLHGTDGKLQIDACAGDGRDRKTLVPNKAFEESPRFSPDGKRVLWVSTRHGNQELYSCAAADGGDVKRLTNDAAMDNAPCWSPDGARVAFASARAGNFEIHTMRADGTDVKRLTNSPSLDTWPAWSPDGKRVAFTSNRDRNYEVYVMDADGGNVRNLTRHKGQDNFAAWSPDGKRIAFVTNRFGGHDVMLMEVD